MDFALSLLLALLGSTTRAFAELLAGRAITPPAARANPTREPAAQCRRAVGFRGVLATG
jgi:hypothetical protein